MRQAEQKCSTLAGSPAKPSPAPRGAVLTLDQMLTEFTAAPVSVKRPRVGLAAATAAGYARALRLPRRVLSVDHLASIRHRTLKSLKRADIARLRLDGAPTELLRKFKVALSWARDRGYIEESPAEGVRLAQAGRDARSLVRRLEDGTYDYRELRAVWVATVARPEYRLALLTAVRPAEVYRLRWQDATLDDRFPTLRVDGKTGERVIPLSDAAVSMLRTLGPKSEGLVFPSPVHRREHARIVAASGVADWSLKSCRKSVRTWLELNAAPGIGRLALGHALSGIDGHYTDTRALMPDVRQAMNAWGAVVAAS